MTKQKEGNEAPKGTFRMAIKSFVSFLQIYKRQMDVPFMKEMCFLW